MAFSIRSVLWPLVLVVWLAVMLGSPSRALAGPVSPVPATEVVFAVGLPGQSTLSLIGVTNRRLVGPTQYQAGVVTPFGVIGDWLGGIAESVEELLPGSLAECAVALPAGVTAIGVCLGAKALGSLGGIALEIVAGTFAYATGFIVDGAASALQATGALVANSTEPELALVSTVQDNFRFLATAIVVPLMMLGALVGMLRRDMKMVINSALVYGPLSIIGIPFGVWACQWILAFSDALASEVVQAGGTDAQLLMDTTGVRVVALASSTAPFLAAMISIIVMLGAISLWITLIVRGASILLVYAFLPLSFCGLVFPSTRRWVSKSFEMFFALAFSKVMIATTMVLAAQVAGQAGNAESTGELLASIGFAFVMMLLGVFSPFMLMRLFPFISSEATSAMQGARIGAVAPVAAGVYGAGKVTSMVAGGRP